MLNKYLLFPYCVHSSISELTDLVVPFQSIEDVYEYLKHNSFDLSGNYDYLQLLDLQTLSFTFISYIELSNKGKRFKKNE